MTDPTDLAPENIYTPAFHARCHLGDLAVAFAEGITVIEPDPEVCHADQFPEEFARLVRGWHRCQDAAHIINSSETDWEVTD